LGRLSRSVAVGLIAAGALIGVLLAIFVLPGASAGPPGPGVGSPSPGGAGLGSAGATASIEPTPSARGSGLASQSSTPPSAASVAPAPSVAGRHVWWIILENHEYGAIIGNHQAPYLSSLADHYGLATNYFAISHPSQPNYVALVAGSTLGVTSDGTYDLDGSSLFDQLRAAGLTWRVYAQNYPGACFTGPEASGGQDGPGASGTYVRKHNPAISFKSVTGRPAQCGNLQPLRNFDPAAGAFEMIVPNLINDMHDGSVAQGDTFMRELVPQIITSPAFASGGVLFVTFDEGGSSAGSLGDHGGRIATLIIASDVTPGYRDRLYLDHWSLLRTTESLLGLACLANACQRSPIGH
jgi:hypothetical protein